MLYSFEKVYPFFQDVRWCVSHGYRQLPGGRVDRFVEDDRPFPSQQWEVYGSKLKQGWIPTTEEFAQWHPLDQMRFEAHYVYGLGLEAWESFSYFYLTFWSYPEMALNFYDCLWHPLDSLEGVQTLEVYVGNNLALAGRVCSGKLTVERRTERVLRLDDHMRNWLVRFVVNWATVLVVYRGRSVLERFSGGNPADYVKMLEGVS